MHEIAPNHPAVPRVFRDQRRCRDPFHRPTHRRAAPPAQKTRFRGCHSAGPGVIRAWAGSGSRIDQPHGGQIRLPPLLGERWPQCWPERRPVCWPERRSCV